MNFWISDAVMYHPVDPDKVFRLLSPRWQIHITHHPPVLPHSQMVAAAVDEHLGEVVELGNELLRFKGERRETESFGLHGLQLGDALSSGAAAFSPYNRPTCLKSARRDT